MVSVNDGPDMTKVDGADDSTMDLEYHRRGESWDGRAL